MNEDLGFTAFLLFALWLALPPGTVPRLWNRRKLIWRSLCEEWKYRE